MMKPIMFGAPVRNDLSGMPYGFWVGLLPRETKAGRFAPIKFRLKFGAYWYPWWRIAAGDRAMAPLLPRFQIEFA